MFMIFSRKKEKEEILELDEINLNDYNYELESMGIL